MSDINPLMSGTGQGLASFLDWAGSTGELSRNTAAGYKTAVTQVLGIDADWLTKDVRNVDIERQLERFGRVRAGSYSQDSLQVYRSRFKTAMEHYWAYLADPSGFRAKGQKASRQKDVASAQGKASKPPAKYPQRSSAGSPTAAPGLIAQVEEPGGLERYPFPLRTNLMVYLSLPRDLRRNEAQRLAAFLISLAVDSGEHKQAEQTE